MAYSSSSSATNALIGDQYRRPERPAKLRKRRELICLLIVILCILLCLSSLTIYNGDIDVGVDLSIIGGPELAPKIDYPSNSKNSFTDFMSDFSSFDMVNGRILQPKLILLWTAWYKDPEWEKVYSKNGGPWVAYNDQDSNSGALKRRYCYLTTNRSLAADADAFIFHSTDFYRNYSEADLPQVPRRPSAPYIFFTLEPPQLNRLNDKAYRDAVNAIHFDYTMSYSRYSDIVFPYGRVLEFNNETRSNPSFIENVRYRISSFVSSFSRRPKDAVWIVSDCLTMGRRENIVRSLMAQGINIDIWGKCWGSRQPDRLWQSFGARTFFQQYRFYLAFENSLCEEYISEKAYLGLAASANYGLIPIVYGLANYSHFLPEGSYIDATGYSNASDLADLMGEMSSTSFSYSKLASFYSWQYKHYVPSDPNWRVVNGWRNLCKHLHAHEPPTPHMRSSIAPSRAPPTSTSFPNPIFKKAANSLNITETNYTTTILALEHHDHVDDIRQKIGACIWTKEFDPEDENSNYLQF